MLFSYDFNKKIKPGGLSPLFKLRASRAALSLLIAFIAAIGTHLIVRAAPTIFATMTGTFVGVHDGDSKADPGETIEYTAVLQNSGADPATGVTFSDVIDLNTTLVNGSLNVSPLAADDSYATIGNTLLEVGVTASGGPAVSVTNPVIDSLFDNDTEFLGDSFTLASVEGDATAPFTTATEQGGSVTVEADGNFSYTPPVGFSGADNFDYVITDDGAVGSGALTGAGRVTINVNAQEVWYVSNDAAPGGLGRSTDPFDTLLEGQSASGPNDTIFVFHAGGDLTGQNNGIILQNGQRLIGEGVSLTMPVGLNGGSSPTTLKAAGTRPLMGNSAGNGVSVTTSSASFSGVEIRGLDISGTGAGSNAVDITTGSTFSGSFEIADNVISSAGAEGIDVNGGGSGTLTVSIHDNTVTAAGNGIDIQRTVGTVNITAFDDNVVTGATGGIGINIVGTGASILFDATPGTAAFDVVTGGATAIGSSGAGNGAGTSGMVLNNIRGDLSFSDLDVYADNGAALVVNGTSPNYTGTSGTRVIANTNTPALVATGGAALDVTDTNINIVPTTFTSSITTATRGVSFLRVSGTLTAPAGSIITSTNASGTGFFVDGGSNANANVNVTYPGTITADIGRLVQIQNVTPTAAASYTFSGAITDNNDGDGGETGVSLAGNTNATITFSGGLIIRTTSNPAFSATGGGTVNVCDENPCNPGATGLAVNTLTSTTGTALNIASTNIGSNNLEFRSISVNGAVNGIVLNTTGSSGGLSVKGNSGGQCGGSVSSGPPSSAATATAPNTADCTGGTIQNTTGPGIVLSNTANVSLTRIWLRNAGNDGVQGTNVTGFTLASSFFDNNGNALNENGLDFGDSSSTTPDGLHGTGSITNSTIQNSYLNNVSIRNFNGVALTSFNITGSQFRNNPANGDAGDNILFEASGTANMTTSVSGSFFASTEGDHFQAAGVNSGTLNVSLTNNTLTGGHSTPLGQGITINAATGVAFGGYSGRVDYDINGNNITGAVSNGVSVVLGTSSAAAVFDGFVRNNVIGASGVAFSCSTQANGVYIDARGNGTHNSSVTGNTIRRCFDRGILTEAGDGDSVLNLTVQSNIIDQQVDDPINTREAIQTNFGITTTNVFGNVDTNNVCLQLGGAGALANTFSHGAGVPDDFRLRKRFEATVRLPGYGGGTGQDAGSLAAVVSFIQGQNTGSAGEPGSASASGTGGGYTGGAACTQPSLAFLPDNNQVLVQNPVETNSMALAPAASTDLDSVNTLNFAFASWKLSEQTSENNLHNTVVNASTSSGGKPLFTVQAVPLLSGETVSVPAFTLPAGKSVTIKFQVTVNGPSLPLGTTQISNQGTVSGSNFSNVLTDDPSAVGGSDPTITPVDRPDTTVTSVNRTGSSSTNAASVSWNVTFADATSGLTSSNFALVNSGLGGTPAITGVTAVGGAPATQWTVTASTGTGDGTLELTMANDTGLSHDITNLPYTQPSSGAVYTIDQTAPTVTNVDSNSNTGCTTVSFIDYCNAGDVVNIRVTFSEVVTVTGAPTLMLDLDGTDRDATYSSGSGTNILTFVYTVQAGDNTNPAAPPPNELDYVSTSALSLNGGTIRDAATNNTSLTLASPGAANSLGATEDIIVDTIAPSTTSFTRFTPSASPTNADILVFRVTFSEPVRTVGIADFVVHDNSPSGTTTTAIDEIGTGGGGMVFEVTLDGTDGDPGDLATFNGTVNLDFNSAAPVDFLTDHAGNNLPKTEPATDQEYTVDNTAPAVTINQAAGQTDPTGASQINFTVMFSEPVSGFVTGDITLNGTAGATTGVVTEVAPNDGTTYNVAVSGMTGDGTVIASINSGVATDDTGNANEASTSTDNTVTFDGTVPTVTINQASGQSDPANASSINFTVVFSEAVTGFATGDVTLGGTANPTTGTVSEIAPNDGTTYNVAVSGMTSDGTVNASIGASVSTDTAGNGNAASTSIDNTVTFDGTVPTVTINKTAGQADPTNASPINFIIVFSEPITGFATGDITLSGTAGATTGVVAEIAPNDGTTYNVAVSGMTGNGTVIASINAGVATDSTGNGNAASTSTDNTVTYDTTGPSVTINQASSQSDPANASSINFTVVFSEAVTGFTTGDVALSGTAGATTGVVTEIAPNDGTTYNVAVGGMTGNGTVTASINAGVATDFTGNGNAASSSTDNTVTYDATTPTVTINQASGQADPASASPINFTVVFSEPVIGFITGDVDLSASTATGTLVGAVSGGPTTYNVAVSGMSGDGTVVASIPAGMATDGANLSTASTSTDNSVLYVANPTDHDISGNVGVGGVVLSYLDGTAKTALSQTDGSYSFTVSFNWSGTVTPTHGCYTFNPPSLSYNNVLTDQTGQDYIATVDSAAGCVDLAVSVAGTPQGQFVIPPQEGTLANFAGVNSGLIKMESMNTVPMLGAEQVTYKVFGTDISYTEMMGMPDSQLDNIYWLPWYNNVDLDTQLRFGNVSNATATVHVYIGGVEMIGSPFTLPPGQSTRVSFDGVNNGPVRIESNVNIVAAERVIYKVNNKLTSFSEMMALPDSQLNTTYWLPWYNHVNLDTQLRFANVSSTTGTVRVYIGGTEMTGSPFTLLAGESRRVSFAGIDNGPVKIEGNVQIVASERLIYKVNGVPTSFSETMGLPDNQIDTTYWLPWYNNSGDLDTQLRFGNVSNSTATVRIYIGGAEMTGSPFTLQPGESVKVSFNGVNDGPVKVESDQNIVVAKRLIYKVNGVPTSFSEMLGLPDSLMSTIYWLPWYNNVDLDTRLRFVVP